MSPPLFFPEKPGDLYLLIAVAITIAFYCFHSGVTPWMVSPTPFLTCPTSFLHYSLQICPQTFFPSGVTPLKGVTRGGPPRSPPPSDATVHRQSLQESLGANPANAGGVAFFSATSAKCYTQELLTLASVVSIQCIDTVGWVI